MVDLGLTDQGAARGVEPAGASTAGRPRKMLTPLIAVAVLLVAAVAIGAWIMQNSRGGAGDDLRYLPDDPDFVVSADVSGIVSSAAGQKIKARTAGLLSTLNGKMPVNSKFKPEDVGRVTFGGRASDHSGSGIIHMNRACTATDFFGTDNAVKETIGQYRIRVNGNMAYCLLDDRTIAIGTEPLLRQALERNGSAKLSDDLQAAMNEVDFAKSLAVASSAKQLAAAGAIPGGMSGIRGIALEADIGDDIRFEGVAVCKDAATADQMKKMADGALAGLKLGAAQMPPEAAKLLAALEVSNPGSTVRATLTIEVETLLSLIDKLRPVGALPGGPVMSQHMNPAL